LKITNGDLRTNAIINLLLSSGIRVAEKLQIMGEDCSWSKLTYEQVKFIRNHIELTSPELSKIFNVAASTIRAIRQNRSWKY